MKKLSVLLMGLVFSGAAFSQVATGTVALTGTDFVRTNTCGLLNEDVRINLTTGVEAGVDCAANRIAMAACHTGGRTVSRSTTVVTNAPCGGVNPDNSAQPACETATQTVTGPAMAGASTANGTVISLYPGGACSAAAAVTNAATR